MYQSDQGVEPLPLPGLLTESGLLLSHLRYLANNIRKSPSWRELSTLSVTHLLNYINANANRFERTVDLLDSFSRALSLGTICRNTLDDPSGLYWAPKRAGYVRAILSHLNNYTDWLCEQPEYHSARANPFRKATSAEQRLNWAAYFQRQRNCFLSHLDSFRDVRENITTARSVQPFRGFKLDVEQAKHFPEDSIERLLKEGC